MRDAGHRTSDGGKSKNNISTPQGGGHNNIATLLLKPNHKIWTADGRAVRLLPDNCVHIELKTRFCAARHVRMFCTLQLLNDIRYLVINFGYKLHKIFTLNEQK